MTDAGPSPSICAAGDRPATLAVLPIEPEQRISSRIWPQSQARYRQVLGHQPPSASQCGQTRTGRWLGVSAMRARTWPRQPSPVSQQCDPSILQIDRWPLCPARAAGCRSYTNTGYAAYDHELSYLAGLNQTRRAQVKRATGRHDSLVLHSHKSARLHGCIELPSVNRSAATSANVAEVNEAAIALNRVGLASGHIVHVTGAADDLCLVVGHLGRASLPVSAEPIPIRYVLNIGRGIGRVKGKTKRICTAHPRAAEGASRQTDKPANPQMHTIHLPRSGKQTDKLTTLPNHSAPAKRGEAHSQRASYSLRPTGMCDRPHTVLGYRIGEVDTVSFWRQLSGLALGSRYVSNINDVGRNGPRCEVRTVGQCHQKARRIPQFSSKMTDRHGLGWHWANPPAAGVRTYITPAQKSVKTGTWAVWRGCEREMGR